MRRAVWRMGTAMVLFLVLFLGGGRADVSASPLTRVTVSVRTQYREAFDALRKVNRMRTSAGLTPLKMDGTLLGNALTRALECSVYYSHRRANGKAWYTAVTKDYIYAGENIGFGFGDAESVTEAWMNSPSHRKNIMNGRYTCVGISCVVVDGVAYWAQEFTDGRAKKVSRPKDRRKDMKIAVSGDVLSAQWTRGRLAMGRGESGRVALFLKNAGHDGLTVQVAASGVKCTSSDRSVVTVTPDGRIRAVGKGKARIRVRLAGNAGICMVYTVSVAE